MVVIFSVAAAEEKIVSRSFRNSNSIALLDTFFLSLAVRKNTRSDDSAAEKQIHSHYPSSSDRVIFAVAKAEVKIVSRSF
ncbi:hypothetical protein DHB64_16985 [Antarcticibacterium sp. W02-3]|nr:hypothetical protein [Antarcticibacterium sp. W02-3]